MRAFIAVELPKEVRAFLSALQSGLKSANADVKWVEPDNIHLTLRFLGEIDQRQAEVISGVLENIASARNSFKLRLSGLGAFPEISSPRVIWVGTEQAGQELKDIARNLEEELGKTGFPREEREFSPHITLGRLRSGKNRQALVKALESLLQQNQSACPEFTVDKITLFKSTLTAKGPVYETVKHLNLKTN